MVRYLFLDPDKCTGCRSCESICSMTNEKVLNRAKSRIKVYRADVLSLVQLYCDQCPGHPCLETCPEGAFILKNGHIRLEREKCTSCRKCGEVCEKIFFLPDTGKAVICNQCGACVPACPEEALEIRKR